MIKLISFLAFIGIWYFHFKEVKEHSSMGSPDYNVMIIFNPESYTDITWYEIFGNFSRWEKSEKYSFKGHIDSEELELLSETIEMELELSPTDYQIRFYDNEGMKTDYIVTFKNILPPRIEEFPRLELLGRWKEYGKNGYRVWLSVSEETLKQTIKEEMGIKEDEFTVYCPSSLAWTRLL